VTSRKPDDIPAFNREMIRLFSDAAASKRHHVEGQTESTQKKKSA
jgi:hypothetical protein